MENEIHFNKKEKKLKFNSFPKELSNIILPVKKLLLQSEDGDERIDFEMRTDIDTKPIRQCVHKECEFYILCICKHCLEYRNNILEIFNDHVKTQKLWKIFEKSISKIYLPLLDNASPEILEKYDYLISRCSNWLINGIINKVKLEHIDFLLDFSWSDKMIIVIFSSILIEDDPYQLFELLSFLVECFVKVYASALTTNFKIVRDSVPPAKFLLTYILNGYKKVCAISEIMVEILFEFEKNYLEKFKCSWVLLNKKMYQKFCYNILIVVIPEFVIKLKTEVSEYEYATLMAEFKQFDIDMALTEKAWQESYSYFKDYQISEENQNRKTRIDYVHTIFNMIYTYPQLNTSSLSVSEWKTNEIVWDQMVAYIKKNWVGLVKEDSMKVSIEGKKCQHCQYLRSHNETFCTCIHCLKLIEPESSLNEKTPEYMLCIKCTFMEILAEEDYNVTELAKLSLEDKIHDMTHIEENELVNDQHERAGNFRKAEVYHYCWAVFKHLKDRKPYRNSVIKTDLFCKNCQITSCLLATKILNNEISDEIAIYLIKHYQPFGITNEDIMQMLPKIWLCFRKGHFPHDHYGDDFVMKTFWIFVISAYASCLARLDIKKGIPTIDRLILTRNDIELSSLSKETSLQSSILLEFIEKIINLLQGNGKSENLNPIMNNDVSKDLNLKSLTVSGNGSHVEDFNLLSKENIIRNDACDKLKNSVNVNNICKSDIKSCGDSDECKNAAKEANGSKNTCSHEKEYCHNRKNETRDRLRKKLKKLVTIEKKPLQPLGEKSKPILTSEENNLQSLCTKENLVIKKNISKNNNSNDKQSNGENTIVTISDIKKDVCEDKTTIKTNCDEKWMKDALSFIEGSKNENGTVNNKKAAKRQKQKMKKEECKRLEELKELRSQFHEVYFKEFMAKKERKIEQLSKKKDKKRVLDLENSVKKLAKIKLRIEKDILELISTLKSMNSEFKFTYLPTKEQQQEFLQVKNSISNCCHSIDIIKIPKEKVVPCKTDTDAPKCEQSEFYNSSKNEQESDVTDASKRIVTIRRVNMPNNNEPQVTVTAKGSCPDEDKVLYTFINGRLVQRDSTNVSEFERSPRINFTQLSEIKNALLQSNHTLSRIGKNPNNERNTQITKTKTQLKKERKLAKKIAENMNDENKLYGGKINKQIIKNEINLKNLKHNECEIIPRRQVDNSVNKSKQRNENSKCNQNILKNIKNEIKICEIQNNIKENGKQKQNHCSIQHSASKICDKIKQNAIKDSERKKIEITKKHDKEEKKKNRKVYNLNVLENNQFNLLHLEDSESFTEESESDTEKTNYKEELQVIPSVKTIKSNIKNSTNHSKLSETIITCNKKKAKAKDLTVNNKKNCHIDKVNVQQSTNNIHYGKLPEKKSIALEESMNNLNINTNNESFDRKCNVTNNISIMEQLKRGIQVENLMLPPGITLTKVNPAKAEELKAKTGSIHNLSQKLPPQQPSSSVHSIFATDNLLSTDFLPPTVNQFLTDNRGVIMVDNITSKVGPAKNLPPNLNDCKNKTKMKKRKNRSKNNNISDTKHLPDPKNVTANSNIITLRNPMFYLSNTESIPYCNLTDRLPPQTTPDSQIDQPATIIRNKNGMFTIRNPVVYQNNAGPKVVNNYGAFSPNYYTSMNSFMQDGDNNSYVSDNTSNDSTKCISAIGSELKSAQQKQCNMFQNQSFKNPNHTNDSCDFVNSLKSFQHDSFFCNTYGNYCSPSSSISSNNTFRSSENLPHNSINTNGTNMHNKNVHNNYNKLSSLLDLKRLSNEVTIHNMNEIELPPERIAQVLNQRENIENANSHNYELDNQQIHFGIFNNLQEHNTDYLKGNRRQEMSTGKVTANNQGSDSIESPLLQTMENNTFCSINSCN